MRKTLLSLTLLAASTVGMAGFGGHPASAAPLRFEPASLAQTVGYYDGDDWRAREWRRHERYEHERRHEQWERWRHRGDEHRGW